MKHEKTSTVLENRDESALLQCERWLYIIRDLKKTKTDDDKFGTTP